jgi:hypothetical protein
MHGKRIGFKGIGFALGIAMLLASLVTCLICTCYPTRVSQGSYRKLKIGMPRSEVEAILGGPGDELGRLEYDDVQAEERLDLLRGSSAFELRYWKNDTHQITVIYDANGRVATKYYKRAPDVWIGRRFLDWLGL